MLYVVDYNHSYALILYKLCHSELVAVPHNYIT